jgi:hypothetical protein
VINSSFELTVADAERTIRLFKEVLGFQWPAGAAVPEPKPLVDAMGTPGAQLSRRVALVPGSSVTLSLLRFSGPGRTTRRTRLQDPGTPMLQLRVRDIQGITTAWKAAGGEVISTGGEPADLGAVKIVVFREPNNLMLEMIEAVAR